MTDDPAYTPKPRWLRLAVIGLALLAGCTLWLTYSIAYDHAATVLRSDARATAQLQVAVLQSELDKQRSTPVILADDSEVIRVLNNPTQAGSLAISEKLAKLQRDTKSAAIYVLDSNGVALSASNYALPTSFVGSNYTFRYYFTEAMRTGQAEQFALGTVSRRPGLYLAHRVESAGRAIGVIVTKVEFDAIEETWVHAGTTTVVTDASDNIILTSLPALRFHKGIAASSAQIITSLPAPAPGWQMHLLSPRDRAEKAATSATLMAAMAELLFAALIVWLWRRRRLIEEGIAAERRYREKLERNVALRTAELSDTNTRLSEEIRERQQTERRLNAMQVDLIQANKLAQLGQITAGVAHEINQPLATIRVLAENCMSLMGQKIKGVPPLIEENLANVVRMCERIGHITGELRAFSRKSTGESGPVPMKAALDASIMLNRSRLRDNRVRLILEPIDPKLQIVGRRVRLEQVVVILLQNAYEALESTTDPEVRITATADHDWVWLRISDNGPGLNPEVMAQLFTPFVTTKEKGLGLGLVIAHDILRDFGGELTAENATSGAVFTLKLRKVAP